jgi:hypothetical protein
MLTRRVNGMQVLEQQVSMALQKSGDARSGISGLHVRKQRMVESVAYKLLITAVADSSERVRRTVLQVGLPGRRLPG